MVVNGTNEVKANTVIIKHIFGARLPTQGKKKLHSKSDANYLFPRNNTYNT